jgi:hypothetical protein
LAILNLFKAARLVFYLPLIFVKEKTMSQENQNFETIAEEYIIQGEDSLDPRTGPGNSYDKLETVWLQNGKDYQVTMEAHGEEIKGDDVWVFVPEFKGWVARAWIKKPGDF